MFGRVRRGWSLTKKARAVIRSHPGLARLPLTGGALALVAFVVLGIPGALLAGSGSTGAGGIAVLAIAAYLASFTVIYFNLALAAADQAMRSGEPDCPRPSAPPAAARREDRRVGAGVGRGVGGARRAARPGRRRRQARGGGRSRGRW